MGENEVPSNKITIDQNSDVEMGENGVPSAAVVMVS